MVWCGVVWCGVMWCDVVWCGVVCDVVCCCGVMWCDVVWCGVVWRGVVWCVVWCGVVCVVVWCGVVCCVMCGVCCGMMWCAVVVWCGVMSFFRIQMVSQLIKKFPAIYVTRRFITSFAIAHNLSLSWSSSIHSIHPLILLTEIYLNIILPPIPGSPKCSLSLMFPHQNTLHTSPLLHTCHMPFPSHHSSFYPPTMYGEQYRSFSSSILPHIRTNNYAAVAVGSMVCDVTL